MADAPDGNVWNVDWGAALGFDASTLPLPEKVLLIYSLARYLGFTILTLLTGLFESKIKDIQADIKRFCSCRIHNGVVNEFGPLSVWNIWVHYSTTLEQNLADFIVKPTALHLGRQEVYRAVRDPSLKVNLSKISLQEVCDNLNPSSLQEKYATALPFTFNMLIHLMETPNIYRLRKKKVVGRVSDVTGDSSSDESDEPTTDTEHDLSDGLLPIARPASNPAIPGLRRTRSVSAMTQITEKLPKKRFLVATSIISSLLYTCNRANNALQSAMGILLSIEGTSHRVITSFRAMGMSISPTAIDQIRTRLSEDAIESAKTLLASARPWIFVFDNINIYLRKFSQRISNHNTMLNLTNTAVVALPEDISVSAFDLEDFQARRGERGNQVTSDLRLLPEEQQWMRNAMESLVAQILIDHCPGRENWPQRRALKTAIKDSLPSDRPIEPRRTTTFPFGAMDINEGSKKGVIEVLMELAHRACMTGAEIAKSVRIVAGDFLTVRNLRSSKADREDDVTDFHRLNFVSELSQLFHYSLNAYTTLIKIYLGADNAMLNASALSRHKDHLGRSFDVNKAPYAETKDLIQTSLYARVLDCVMQVKRFREVNQLRSWKPNQQELQSVAKEVVDKFARSSVASAELGQHKIPGSTEAGDHVLAHSVLFIRDALILQVFDHGIRNGDPGIVLRVIKYWMFSFRGSGQINYMRECLEVLLVLEHEVSPQLRSALEHSWFYNRWGKPGRFIALDLYLEHLNYWVKRVYSLNGSGNTAHNIITKGSACVEAFRSLSHQVEVFCGLDQRNRRHKASALDHDIRVLMDLLKEHNVHHRTSNRPLWKPASNRSRRGEAQKNPEVVDIIEIGLEGWNKGKLHEYIEESAYSQEHGYPVSELLSSNGEDGMQAVALETEEDVRDAEC